MNIELDLTSQRESAMSATYVLIIVFVIFAILRAYILRQLLVPILIYTAQTLASAIRPSDYVIRYGGEEFFVIISDTDDVKVLEIAERIRHQIEATHFSSGEIHFNKTISIGVALFPHDAENFDTCTHSSD